MNAPAVGNSLASSCLLPFWPVSSTLGYELAPALQLSGMPALSPYNPAAWGLGHLSCMQVQGYLFLGLKSMHVIHQTVQKACKLEVNILVLEQELPAAVPHAKFASTREWG